MNFLSLVRRAEKLAVDNSPVILTALAVTGSLTTAYLTGKATFKAAKLIEDERFRRNLHEKTRNDPFDTKDKFKLVWHAYLPAAGTCAATVTCIVAANRIGSKRAAAVAAAYTISEKAFEEYRSKVVERLGVNKEQSLRDDLAQDRVNRDPVGSREVIIAGSGNVLCYDSFTGRYFESSMEDLKKAMNDTNYQVLNSGYASLSEFYKYVGLKPTSYSDEVGWNVDKTLELEFSTTITDDGKPCIVVDFLVAPIRGYYRVH